MCVCGGGGVVVGGGGRMSDLIWEFFAQLNQKILPCFNFDFTKFHLKRRDTVYCFQSQYGSK